MRVLTGVFVGNRSRLHVERLSQQLFGLRHFDFDEAFVEVDELANDRFQGERSSLRTGRRRLTETALLVARYGRKHFARGKSNFLGSFADQINPHIEFCPCQLGFVKVL
ncbi:hypothetical protein D3C87_1665530 [compost metagenome]